MDFKETMAYIEQVGSFGMSPGLSSIRELCRRMGDPQNDLQFVHIAGTNGKGSIAAYLASVLQCGGYRTGMYTSPALLDYRDIIRVNGHPITKKALCQGVELLKAVCDGMVSKGLSHPTLFELETALGFWYFREKKCDIVVLETGMGGLLDATNVVKSTCVAVLSSISFDHRKFLGDTLAEIASQKAGIIKTGCRVVSAAQKPEVEAVISEKAAAMGCPLAIAEEEKISHIRYGLEKQKFDYGGWKGMEISLGGFWQIGNASVALEALKALAEAGFPVSEEKVREGMGRACWPGRFTVVGRKPYFIVDGAHNEDAARQLGDFLRFYFPDKRILYIMGMLRDKEYEKVITLTHSLADQIITVTPPDNRRALSAYELAQEIAKVHEKVTVADSLEEAVEMSYLLAGKEDVILAFGSLSFLGRLMEIAGDAPGGSSKKR